MSSKRVGEALRAIRRAAGMTLQEVSDEAGVSHSYLSRVENGLVQPRTGWVELVALTIGHRLAEQAEAGKAAS